MSKTFDKIEKTQKLIDAIQSIKDKIEAVFDDDFSFTIDFDNSPYECVTIKLSRHQKNKCIEFSLMDRGEIDIDFLDYADCDGAIRVAAHNICKIEDLGDMFDRLAKEAKESGTILWSMKNDD